MSLVKEITMRSVRDLKLAFAVPVREAPKVFVFLFSLLTIMWTAFLYLNSANIAENLIAIFIVSIFISVPATFFFALFVFSNYYKGIRITNKYLSIPASDVENSLVAFLLGKSIWGHMFQETLMMQDLERVDNDGHGRRWRINLSGEFGSRQIEFSSKQKRDECRAAILKYSSGGRADSNMDFGG